MARRNSSSAGVDDALDDIGIVYGARSAGNVYAVASNVYCPGVGNRAVDGAVVLDENAGVARTTAGSDLAAIVDIAAE